MHEPYITVTLEVAGTDERVLHQLHQDCCELLLVWLHALDFGEVNISYQDQAQIEADAQVEAEGDDEDAWYEG